MGSSPLTLSLGDEEGGSQQQEQQEGAESHGAATGAEQGKAWEQSTHCCLVLRLLLFISGFLAFVFRQPGRQPTSRPRAG